MYKKLRDLREVLRAAQILAQILTTGPGCSKDPARMDNANHYPAERILAVGFVNPYPLDLDLIVLSIHDWVVIVIYPVDSRVRVQINRIVQNKRRVSFIIRSSFTRAGRTRVNQFRFGGKKRGSRVVISVLRKCRSGEIKFSKGK